MDVRQYFNPVDFSVFSGEGSTWKYTLGQTIERSTERVTVTNLYKIDVAIVGAPFENGVLAGKKTNVPDEIRSVLYHFAGFQSKLNIVDFGNLKTAKSSKSISLALRDLVEYFNELNIVTIVLGGSQDLSFGICQAFKAKEFFSLCCIDSELDVKKGRETFDASNFLSRVFSNCSNLFQFSLLAYQSLLVPHQLFAKTYGINEHYRLGLLRDDISFAEPVLRNTDFLSFDVGAVKHSEAPATWNSNPNGLHGEEACQLAKYAGLSDKLKVVGVFGIDSLKLSEGITIRLAAEIVWYFLDGQINKQVGVDEQRDVFLTYKVEVKDVEKPLVFLQCPKTHRWWMEIQSIRGRKLLIACSEKEYEQAADDEIPELWLKYVQKIDGISK